MQQFQDKIVLVTGASAGIGAATVVAFAREGAKLILLARREDRLEKFSRELKEDFGTECFVLPFDLRDHHGAAKALADLPEEWQAVDVLVNNAGLARGMDKLHEGDLDEWDEVIDVNIRGLLAVTRTVIPWMLKRNTGHIINLGSIAGHEVYPNGAIYCASKHAVRALSQGMKMDLQGTPIRVTSIDPGLVETEFSIVRFRGDTEKAKTPYVGIEPLHPADIADAVVWSASRPAHVNIADMIIFPTAQASSMLVDRKP